MGDIVNEGRCSIGASWPIIIMMALLIFFVSNHMIDDLIK